MDKKDLLGRELKSLMEEDTRELELSQGAIDNIMNTGKLTWRGKLNNFLNREIEIPLAPAIVGFAALILITIIPRDIFKNTDMKVVNIGSSQVFIKEKEVSWNEIKN